MNEKNFIRRISVASNAIQTIDNETTYLIIYCLNCVRRDGNSTYTTDSQLPECTHLEKFLRPIYTIRFVVYDSDPGVCDRINTRTNIKFQIRHRRMSRKCGISTRCHRPLEEI